MTDPLHPRSPEPKELDAALGRLLTPPSAPPPAPSTVRGLRKTLREERARLWCTGPIGTPLGAVLTLPRPGRIEMLLGTPLGPADDPTPTGRCLEAALASGRQTDNHLAQLVHVPEAVGTAEAAKLGGMEWLAELQFLRTASIPEPAASMNASAPLQSNITWCDCDDLDAQALHAVLLKTYVDAQDCPGLRGRREPEDILIGHEASGVRHQWMAAKIEQELVGVLLLAETSERHLLQVLYVGVVPKFRGKGLGQKFMAKANEIAISRKLPLSLHVDRRNTAALKLYRKFDLQPRESRVAWIAEIR